MSDGVMLSRLVKAMKNKENEPLGPLIDKYLMVRGGNVRRLSSYTIHTQPRVRPGGRLSPSTIGGCHRQSAFKFIGVPGRKKIDPDQEMLFEMGNWVHHMCQSMFMDMEVVLGQDQFKLLSIEEHVKIPRLFIGGWLDAAIEIENKTKRVVDFKSIGDYGFKRIIDDNAPPEAHIKQLTTYLKARNIPVGLLFYLNKNDQRRKIFQVRFDPIVWRETESWCKETLISMRDRELPPMHPDCSHGNFLYSKCPWSHVCFSGSKEEKIRERVYANFRGVKRSWKEGNKIAG